MYGVPFCKCAEGTRSSLADERSRSSAKKGPIEYKYAYICIYIYIYIYIEVYTYPFAGVQTTPVPVEWMKDLATAYIYLSIYASIYLSTHISINIYMYLYLSLYVQDTTYPFAGAQREPVPV